MVDPQRLEALRAAATEELARREITAFAQLVMPGYELAPHAKLVLDTLQRLESGEIKRLILSQPPQTGKSTALQLFAAFVLGRDPSRRVVTASYGEELAFRNSRIIREFIKSPEFPFAKKGFFVRIRQRNWARPLAARPSYGRLLPALNA